MNSAGGLLGGYGGRGGVGDPSWRDEPREPGTRRRKIAGYLKAANELRQTYQQSYMDKWAGTDGVDDDYGDVPGSYPREISGAAAQNGDEELIMFPSYARNYVRHKPSAVPSATQDAPRLGRDVTDTVGEGDTEYFQQQLNSYEDDNAKVDIDVRGWIYTPHRGPLNRKNRLFVGLARQMVGIPAPGTSPSGSVTSSRPPSPHGLRQRVEAQNSRHEEEIVAKEAESLMKKGEAEADAAHRGVYSEEPWRDGSSEGAPRRGVPQSQPDESSFPPAQSRPSWNTSAQMSQTEVAEANKQLMSRLRPFLANPVPYTPISAFFYNDVTSRQKTINTDANGHFNLRAPLDFIPTHVRVLTREGLSATQPVHIVPSKGVSVISDIDDTIKHSAITSGAREIFRNVFVRDLKELSIPGVQEWYKRLENEGVTFHYVSNSPWQLYPLLKIFFSMHGFPKGSFHLKLYSGMLQGIFEPVAERKKGTLERILRDFPERRFILVGDSGEADLEVYTEIVRENPGRVLGVFIRDITTSSQTGFFDPSVTSQQQDRVNVTNSKTSTSKLSNGSHQSRGIMNETSQRPALPPRRISEPAPIEEDLIDLSSDIDEPPPNKDEGLKSVEANQPKREYPVRPLKPRTLSSISVVEKKEKSNITRKPAPPVPKKPSSLLQASTSSDTKSLPESLTTQTAPPPVPPPETRPKQRPPVPPKQPSYRSLAAEKISAAYNSLPSASAYLQWDNTFQGSPQQPSSGPSTSVISKEGPKSLQSQPAQSQSQPPPLPSRKPASTSSATARPRRDLNGSARPSSLANGSNPTQKLNHSNTFPTSSNSYQPDNYQTSMPSNATANRKEELWRRRWADAKVVLDSRGVMLRSWRVGGDIEETVVKLVKKAEKEGTSDKR